MLSRFRAVLALTLLVPLAALAQVAADPGTDLGGFLAAMVEAARGGKWPLLVSLALIGVVWAVRKWVPWPALKSKFGGWVLNFLGAAAVAVTAALQGGASLKDAILPALGLAFAAAGGYEALRDLVPWVLSIFAPKVGPA